MRDRTLALCMAKLAVAVAWADGEVDPAELNTLKQRLVPFDLGGRDWRELDLYLDHPVDDEELQALLDNVLLWMATPGDRTWVIDTLTDVVAAGGSTPPQQEHLARVVAAVQAHAGGLLGTVGTLLGGGARRLVGRPPRAVREEGLEDFLHNPVFYRLHRRGDPDEGTLRSACLCAGLMAVVAAMDGTIADAERSVIESHLVEAWSLSAEEAGRVAAVAVGPGIERIDAYRLGDRAKLTLDRPARLDLMERLVRVARADGLGQDEEYALRRISTHLGLTHKEFVSALRLTDTPAARP